MFVSNPKNNPTLTYIQIHVCMKVIFSYSLVAAIMVNENNMQLQ